MLKVFIPYVLLLVITAGAKGQSLEIADSLKVLALAASDQENWLEAAQLFEEVLAIERKIPAPRDEILFVALHGSGLSFYQLDSLDKAFESAQKAHELALVAFPEPSRELGEAKHLLGMIHGDRAEYDEALNLYSEALNNTERSLGKETASYSDQLDALGSLHTAMGEYGKALPIFQESLEITRTIHGTKHPEYGSKLNNLGSVYIYMGRYDEALPYIIEAVENAAQFLGKEHEDYGVRLSNLAILYFYTSDYDKSLAAAIEALQNAETNFGKQYEYYGMRLNMLAKIYETMGRYDLALPLFIEALEDAESTWGKQHPTYGVPLNNLAFLYKEMGQYEKALPLFQQSIELTILTLGKDHERYGIAINNLAILHYEMSEYNKALTLFQEALENTEKALGKDHPKCGLRHGNLGNLYRKTGDYENAFASFTKALENTEKNLGTDHPDYGMQLYNMALIYSDVGQNDKALPLYRVAVHIAENKFGKDHQTYGNRLTGLGQAYIQMGKYEEALPLLLEALENAERSLGIEHYEYGRRLELLSKLYSATGDYEKAAPLYAQALGNAEESLGRNHSEYGGRLANYATLFYFMGQYDKALPMYVEALQNGKINFGITHPSYGVRLGKLGRLYEALGSEGEAYSTYVEHLDIIYNQIDQFFTFMSENEKEEFYKTIKWYFNAYLSFFSTYAAQRPEASAQAYNIELALKGLILDSGIKMRESILSSGDVAAIETYDAWELQRKIISKQYSLPIANRRSDLSDLEERTNQLEAALTRMSADFGAAVATGSVHWKAVQSALGSEEAAIEFSTFDYHHKGGKTDSVFYYAHILLPESEYPVSVFLFEQSELQALLTKTNERDRNYVQRIYGIAERGAGLVSADQEVNLSQLIWDPIAAVIKGKSRVYYAPSGLLHRLNLNAIALDAYTTVADRVELVQLGSTGDLLRMQRDRALQIQEVALFGGLHYTPVLVEEKKKEDQAPQSAMQATEVAELNANTTRSSWGNLPYTLHEVESIAIILTENGISHNLFTGDAGTEESFLTLSKEKKNLDVLHFATHGYFFERDTTSLNLFMRSPNPLFRSGLIMSNANQAWVQGHFKEGQEDGVLTAYEIAQLDLRNTELVVLSACETGLGDISNSEGVYGLQRAFKLAGADYIIMTLWRVPDKQSKIMMEKFYDNWLSQGQSIPEAFRNAQSEMRQLFDTYEWAGFVLVE